MMTLVLFYNLDNPGTLVWDRHVGNTEGGWPCHQPTAVVRIPLVHTIVESGGVALPGEGKIVEPDRILAGKTPDWMEILWRS